MFCRLILLFLVLGFSPVLVCGQYSSFRSLLEQARQGDVDAQNELGIAYSEGKGVRPNQKMAVYWYRKSAEQGYAIATCNLGLHYGQGWGVRRNLTLMMKYVFAAHALDGLKCNPADYIEYFKPKPSECQIEKGWELAVVWLKAHPDFKNNFGEKPWMEENGEYPVTVRENAPSIDLPPKQKGKCKPKRRVE